MIIIIKIMINQPLLPREFDIDKLHFGPFTKNEHNHKSYQSLLSYDNDPFKNITFQTNITLFDNVITSSNNVIKSKFTLNNCSPGTLNMLTKIDNYTKETIVTILKNNAYPSKYVKNFLSNFSLNKYSPIAKPYDTTESSFYITPFFTSDTVFINKTNNKKINNKTDITEFMRSGTHARMMMSINKFWISYDSIDCFRYGYSMIINYIELINTPLIIPNKFSINNFVINSFGNKCYEMYKLMVLYNNQCIRFKTDWILMTHYGVTTKEFLKVNDKPSIKIPITDKHKNLIGMLTAIDLYTMNNLSKIVTEINNNNAKKIKCNNRYKVEYHKLLKSRELDDEEEYYETPRYIKGRLECDNNNNYLIKTPIFEKVYDINDNKKYRMVKRELNYIENAYMLISRKTMIRAVVSIKFFWISTSLTACRTYPCGYRIDIDSLEIDKKDCKFKYIDEDNDYMFR